MNSPARATTSVAPSGPHQSFSSIAPSSEGGIGSSVLRRLAESLSKKSREEPAQSIKQKEDPISQALASLPVDTVVTLGRRGDIAVAGARVEDFHATLTKKDGYWILQDGGNSRPSQQGVSVVSDGASRRITEAVPVFPGEIIAFGGMQVRLPPCELSPFPAGLSTLIGRGDRNTIQIPENAKFVSRGHCTVERKTGGEYFLSDGVGGVASSHGTEVRGIDGSWSPVESEQVQIVPGQEFRLGGRYVFSLENC